jgi:hypothetical protein
MTESQVVQRWTEEARREGELRATRKRLLQVLHTRFPGVVPTEVEEMVNHQDSMAVLDEWFQAALAAFSMESFVAVLRR